MPRRDYSKVAFAATGDTTVIPTPVQPDGSISLQSGWGFDYQRDNGAGGGTPDPLAKNINRADMNGVLNEVTASIGEIQQYGFALWVPSGAPYPLNACVRNADANWQSVITNNNEEPGTGGNWRKLSDLPAGGLIARRVFKTSTTYTPTPGTVSVVVEVLGGGGGGGGIGVSAPNTVAAPGGGGGGYGIRRIISGFAGAAITIGAGGLGSNNLAGATGVASSFGSLLTGGGGGGGGIGIPSTGTVTVAGVPGVSGTSATADSSRDGGAGDVGIAGPSFTLAGKGGSSYYGSGAPGGAATGPGIFNGNSAVANSGGGGAGAVGFNNGAGTFAKGGDGGSGIVIVWEYS